MHLVGAVGQAQGARPGVRVGQREVVGDAAAAVHRGWINIKSAITSQDDNAILGECETGDKVALEAYEQALKAEGLPVEAKSIIQKQHGEILAAKNQITALKH